MIRKFVATEVPGYDKPAPQPPRYQEGEGCGKPGCGRGRHRQQAGANGGASNA